MGWSPEQFVGRMELDGAEHAISPESVYRHPCSPAGRRAGLARLLTQRKPKRAGGGASLPFPTGCRSSNARQRRIFAAS